VGNKKVVMIGCDPRSPGGMSSVVETYRLNGLFESGKIVYLSSYNSPNKIKMVSLFVLCYIQLLIMLVKGSVSIVHVHSASKGSFWRKYLLLKLSSKFNAKTIFHLHSGEFTAFYQRQKKFLQLKIIRFIGGVDLTIVLTPFWKKELEAIVPNANIKILFNPVDMLKTSDVREENTLLFLGRLRKEKGVYELLEACKQLNDDCIDFRLKLAGDGDIEYYKQHCIDLGIAARVDVLGWVSGKAKDHAILSSDIYVLPSYFEGLPIGILEAMINKLAVVATPVGGIPDVIESSKTGILVEEKNVNELKDALKLMLVNKQLKETIRAQAFLSAKENFETNKILKTLLGFYSELGLIDHEKK